MQTEKAQADEQVEKYKSAYGNLITSTEEKIKTMQTQVSESDKTLQSERERANTEQKAREQAETISAMLSEQVEQLKAQVANLTAKANKADELHDELSKLKVAYSDKEKALANAEIAKDTAVKYAIADTAGKYQRKIDEMQLKIDDIRHCSRSIVMFAIQAYNLMKDILIKQYGLYCLACSYFCDNTKSRLGGRNITIKFATYAL